MALMMQKSAFAGARVAPKPAVVLAARSRQTVKAQALFGFGAKKEEAGAAPALMICVDCGYIYDGADFKKEPGSYKCPVCNSGKNRFKVYKGTDVKGRPNNSPSVMQKRKQAKAW